MIMLNMSLLIYIFFKAPCRKWSHAFSANSILECLYLPTGVLLQANAATATDKVQIIQCNIEIVTERIKMMAFREEAFASADPL